MFWVDFKIIRPVQPGRTGTGDAPSDREHVSGCEARIRAPGRFVSYHPQHHSQVMRGSGVPFGIGAGAAGAGAGGACTPFTVPSGNTSPSNFHSPSRCFS